MFEEAPRLREARAHTPILGYCIPVAPERGCCFDGLKLRHVDLSGSGGLQGSTWKKCDISNVELSGCELSGNDFTDAVIVMTDFADDAAAQAAGICNEKVLAGDRYKYATSWKQTIAKAILEYKDTDLLGSINFKGAVIPSNTFKGDGLTDISCVKSLQGIHSTNLDLAGITVGPPAPGVSLRLDNMVDMSGADLKGLACGNDNGTHTHLWHVDFTNADLSSAILSGSDISNCIFKNTCPKWSSFAD